MLTFLKTFSVATLCAVMLFNTTASKAAVTSYNFDGFIDSGLYLGETFTGSFAFDNATLTNSGSQSIGLTSFIFNFLSSSFTLVDANPEVAPTANFLNGSFLGISFTSLIANIDPTFSFVSAYGTGLPEDKAYLAYQTDSGESGNGSINNPQIAAPLTKTVPLPAGALLLLASGLGFISCKSRRVNSQNK
jgi:hypothetical protein